MGARLSSPRLRTLAWAAPYVLVVLAAASVHPLLVLPSAAVSAVVFAAYERLHGDHWQRYPAGWLLALLLMAPCFYFVGYGTPWPAVLLALPAAVLVVLSLATRGRLRRWWSLNPVFGTIIYALLVCGLTIGSRGRGMPPPTDDVLFELYAAPKPPELSQPAMERAIALVDQTLCSYERDGAAAAERPVSLPALSGVDVPPELRRVTDADVTVTLWLPGEAPLRGRASEGALFADLVRATRRALDGSAKWRTWVEGAPRVRIQVDLAGEPVRLSRRWAHPIALLGIGTLGPISRQHVGRFDMLHQLIYEVEPGVDGLTLQAAEQQATMLPSDPVTFGWLTPRVRFRPAKLTALLQRLSAQAGGRPELWQQSGTELYKFRTLSFGRPSPETGGQVVRFYRGNSLLDEVDSERILEAIHEAGLWLNRVVRADGSFDYEYLPNQARHTKDYNAVRHAGTVYGLFHLYHLALREERLRPDANSFLEAAVRTSGWLYPRLRPPPSAVEQDLVALIDRQGQATSGAAALTLLSFLERPSAAEITHPVLREALSQPRDERIVEGLGRFLLTTIDAHGMVFHNYAEARSLPEVKNEPLYFPGEVMLALARLYRATGEPQWLEGAERVGRARIERFYRSRPNPDHWVMQAMWELYDLTRDERYADCGLDMGDAHAFEQYPPQWQPFADYEGSYRRIDDVPRTTRACSRSEAMGGVVRIAWRMGVDARPYENALLGAAKHLIENQWCPDNSFYLPDFEKARGAIRMGLVDNHCRIDNNQHGVVGLTNALVVARRREGAPSPTQIVLPPAPTDEEVDACRRRIHPRSPAPELRPSR